VFRRRDVAVVQVPHRRSAGSISLYVETKATIRALPLPTLVEVSDLSLAIAPVAQ
jgi:hypothetical protein